MNALNHVLKYVAEIVEYELYFRRDDNPVTYSDLAYNNNKLNRKSIYDYVLLRGQAAYIWISKKQRDVATSITKTKYIALTKAAKIII